MAKAKTDAEKAAEAEAKAAKKAEADAKKKAEAEAKADAKSKGNVRVWNKSLVCPKCKHDIHVDDGNREHRVDASKDIECQGCGAEVGAAVVEAHTDALTAEEQKPAKKAK